MTDTITVSGEIVAWCTKCKLELAHTIVAIVDDLPKKVQCNTCNAKHNYRTKPQPRSTKAVRKPKLKEPTYEEHLDRLTSGDLSNSKEYNIKGIFEKDEIIDHPRFGIGVVLSVVKTNKIEVLFREGPKLLIQNQ